jgi:hypothetical protein
LAKARKTSNNTFEIEIDNPTIVDVAGTPIGQDPHRWIKKENKQLPSLSGKRKH